MATVYRCTACMNEHAYYVQACARCGSWAMACIPDGAPPPAVIEAPPVDDAPPTPRDKPADDVGEMMEVAALRAVEGKPSGVCSQVNCGDTATHRFTWPGHAEASACPRHAKAAASLAEAMGFFLEVPAL